MRLPSCPECSKNKWATIPDPHDFRRDVFRCMECGFEVDKHLALRARGILRRDGGQDVGAGSAAEVSE